MGSKGSAWLVCPGPLKLGVKIGATELLPLREVIQFCPSLHALNVIRDFLMSILAAVFQGCVHAGAHQELAVKATSRIHADLFCLPHQWHIRWIANRVQQQAAPVEVVKSVVVFGNHLAPVGSPNEIRKLA